MHYILGFPNPMYFLNKYKKEECPQEQSRNPTIHQEGMPSKLEGKDVTTHITELVQSNKSDNTPM